MRRLMQLLFIIIGTFVYLLSQVACSSLQRLMTRHESEVGKSSATSIIFVVDGLSAKLLTAAIERNDAPNIASFFQLTTETKAPETNASGPNASGPNASGPNATPTFPLARASFPSLTYPNLVSIITGRPINEHGVIGYLKELDDLLAPIFAQLSNDQGRPQVLFTADHGFMNSEKGIDLDLLKERLPKGLQISADNRLATVRVPASWSNDLRQGTAEGRSTATSDWLS